MPNPRLPDKIKAERGTLRKDRSNPDAPELQEGRPVPPDHLDDEELAAFWWLVEKAEEQGVCDPRHVHLFTMFALHWPRMVRLAEKVKQDGDSLWIEAANGGQKVQRNPDSSALGDVSREVRAILSNFGLGPADMGRVSAKKPEKKDAVDPWKEAGFDVGAN